MPVSDELLNPFGVDPGLDLPAARVDAPGWSENMFFQMYDHDRRVGIFSHIGRHRLDTGLWRAVLALYVGDGVYVSRSFGRSVDDRGPAAGCLEVRCEEPLRRWHLRYDGAAELLSARALAAGGNGGGPTRPVAFDLSYRAAGPVYDMFASARLGQQDWGHVHHEQAFRVDGTLTVSGDAIIAHGMGYRDHSIGAREMGKFGGNNMLYGLSERGRVIQGIEAFGLDGTRIHADAYYVEDGRFEQLALEELPELANAAGDPGRFTARYVRGGEPFPVEGEVLANAAFTISDPNDWSLGVAVPEENPLVIVESPVRLVLPDGDVAYGCLERNRRLSALS